MRVMEFNTGLVITLTAVILQNILFLTVSCNYHNRPPWDQKNNCDPFQFCPNKGPSNLPKPCSRNGAYPDDLTFENTNLANYSQYRAALALRPCFSTERANLGFESEDDFKIIEVFTDNNIRRKQFDINPFGEILPDSDDQFTAVAIVFEEPESRKALIEYLSNPGAPERSCFNDGQYLDGKELFKRLCLPQKITTYGSHSKKEEKTLDQCIWDAAEDDTAPKIESFEGFCRLENGRSKDLIEDVPTPNIGSCYQECKDRIGCVAFAFTPENTDNCDLYRGGPYTRGSGRAGSQCFPLEPEAVAQKRSAETSQSRTSGDTSVFRNRLRFPFLNPNPVNEPSNQNELAIQNEIRNPKQLEATNGSTRAPFPSGPPTPLYGMRIRIRTYSPCGKDETFCDSLPVVDCGGERFSTCYSQWENCIGPDEKYLREETNYYRNIETCPHYYPGDENDPYPGQPFLENVKQPKTNHYSQYIYKPHHPKITHHPHHPHHPKIHSSNRRQFTGEQIKAANTNCRKMTNKGNERRCDETIEIRKESLEELNEIRMACGNGRCDFK